MQDDVKGDSHRDRAGKMTKGSPKELRSRQGPVVLGLCGCDDKVPRSKKHSLRMGEREGLTL